MRFAFVRAALCGGGGVELLGPKAHVGDPALEAFRSSVRLEFRLVGLQVTAPVVLLLGRALLVALGPLLLPLLRAVGVGIPSGGDPGVTSSQWFS